MGAEIRFTGEGIPITEAARIMKKDQQFIRQAMIKGILPIGLAFTMKHNLSGNQKSADCPCQT